MDKTIQPINGLKISRIITGLWQLADMERDGKHLDTDRMTESIQQYVDAGLTTFDMADHYGSSELIMGSFHTSTQQSDQVQLLTKWVPKPGKSSKETVYEAVRRALVRLKLSSLPLLQYHAWNYADPVWLDHLFWLNEIKEEGLIHHLGLTNVDATHLKLVLDSGILISTNQISYSLLDQRAAGQMTTICEKYGVKLLAFGTLAGGFLTEKWMDQPEPTKAHLLTWSQMKYKRYIDVVGGWQIFQAVLKGLNVIAQKLHCSLSNLATAYMLHQPSVSAIIIGARLGISDHIQSNLTTLDLEIPQQYLKEINSLLDLFDLVPGSCGDEYRKPPYLTAAGDLSDHLDKIPNPYLVNKINAAHAVINTGTNWEHMASYSRAVKRENRILISGTTATHQNKLIGGSDPASQTHFIIDKIEGILQSFEASLSDVIRTRIFIKRMQDWQAIALAHGQRFRSIMPANTLVQADLIGDEYLVEIEAEAVV